MKETILKKEKQFIYLLLKDKEFVNDYIESSLSPICFHSEHRNILRAIEDAYEKDVLLTRRSYAHFIGQFKSPKERIAQEVSFNSCLASIAKPDD